jgi:hypothetical protein
LQAAETARLNGRKMDKQISLSFLAINKTAPLLLSDGGAIEVTVNDSTDSKNVQAIRSHLTRIVAMFSNGDFSTPMFVHSQAPTGVSVMTEKRGVISYSFEELPDGGRIRIRTGDADALNAIHDFLRFQINDHGTGDKTD